MFNNSTMFNKVYTETPKTNLNYSNNNILKSTFIYENGKGKIVPSKSRKKNKKKQNYQSFNDEFLKEFHSKDMIISQKNDYSNSKNYKLNNGFVKSNNYDKSYTSSKYYHQNQNILGNKKNQINYPKKKSNLSLMRENERLKNKHYKSKMREIPIIVPNQKYIRNKSSLNISTIPHKKPPTLNPLNLDVSKNLKPKKLQLKDMKKNLKNEAYEEYREKYHKSVIDNLSNFPDFPSWTNNSFNDPIYNLRKTKFPQSDRKMKKKDIKREKKMEAVKKKFNIDHSNKSFLHKKKNQLK